MQFVAMVRTWALLLKNRFRSSIVFRILKRNETCWDVAFELGEFVESKWKHGLNGGGGFIRILLVAQVPTWAEVREDLEVVEAELQCLPS